MRTNFLLLSSFLWLALFALDLSVYAENPGQEFADANEAYSDGRYDEAISGYERLLRAKGLDSAVYFNLGNAYFQKGELGEAILNYERSLKLSPKDPDVIANLKVAREAAGIEVPELRWWQSVLISFTPSQWAYLASFCLFLLAGIALAYWFRPQSIAFLGFSDRGQVRIWRFILFFVFVGFAAAVAFGALATSERNYAVVTVEEAPVLQSPFIKAKEVASLPEGETIVVDKIDKTYGDFVRVRYGKRQLGWVSRNDVAAIDPKLW